MEKSTPLGTQVNTWADKSENNKTVTGGLGPTYSDSNEKLMNYHPVMTMDGIDDNFQTSSITGLGTHSDINLFVVSRINAAPHTSTLVRESVVGGGISSHLPWSNGHVFWDAGISTGDGRLNTPSGLQSGDDAMWLLSNHDGATDLQYIRKKRNYLKK